MNQDRKTTECKRLRPIIDRVTSGAALPDRDMDDLAEHLDACPTCAALLSDTTANPADPPIGETPTPTPAEWDRVWSAIESADESAEADLSTARRHAWWTRWAPLSAAAALLLVVGIWSLLPENGAAAWEFRVARGAESRIESLEVYGDDMSVVLAAGEDDAASIIWVMEDEGSIQ